MERRNEANKNAANKTDSILSQRKLSSWQGTINTAAYEVAGKLRVKVHVRLRQQYKQIATFFIQFHSAHKKHNVESYHGTDFQSNRMVPIVSHRSNYENKNIPEHVTFCYMKGACSKKNKM